MPAASVLAGRRARRERRALMPALLLVMDERGAFGAAGQLHFGVQIRLAGLFIASSTANGSVKQCWEWPPSARS